MHRSLVIRTCVNRRGGCAAGVRAVLLVGALTAAAPGQSIYDPSWADAAPERVLAHRRDPALDDRANGALLADAIRSLAPGDRLEIGPGTWSIERRFNISLRGTPARPIWIVAADGAAPRITRSDAAQNVINVGDPAEGRSEYLCLRGLEIVGGSMGLRLHACSEVWIDGCHVHHTGDAAITANTADTESLHITRNHVHHTSGTGEGMYLGANDGAHVMRHSVIALNHVHHTLGAEQGDGIEVKQGSYGNWIARNLIHHTRYPCLLVYGTGGEAPNLIEHNVLYSSLDNVLQVQGEAIVRHNLIMDGAVGFQSFDHQGRSRNLVFIHNTVINRGRAADFRSWDERPGMVCANNAFYSETMESMRFAGSRGVALAGNVVHGPVLGASTGFVRGTGLSDFEDVAWDASARDARPAPDGALVGAAAAEFHTRGDREVRASPPTAGCNSNGPAGVPRAPDPARTPVFPDTIRDRSAH